MQFTNLKSSQKLYSKYKNLINTEHTYKWFNIKNSKTKWELHPKDYTTDGIIKSIPAYTMKEIESFPLDFTVTYENFHI